MPGNSALPLTITNIVLGVLVIGAVLYILSGPLRDMYARLRRRRAFEEELNHDMAEMFPSRATVVAAAPVRAGAASRIWPAIGRAWRWLTTHRN